MSIMYTGIEWKQSSLPVDYQHAIAEMNQRAGAIRNGDASELIWFLEHPSIYTCGTSGKASDVLMPEKCPVYQTGRGGQVTYHGPGQRIVYALLDLEKRGKDIKAYVYKLEEWILKTLEVHGIKACRRKSRVGIWVPRTDSADDKIAAIGVRVKKWVTLHGFALNVSPDLSFYQGIVPCGIQDHGITSFQALNKDATLSDIDDSLKKSFSKVF